MPEFIVRVGTPDGEVVERHVEATSVREARDELRRQGMHVFDARRGAFSLRELLPMRIAQAPDGSYSQTLNLRGGFIFAGLLPVGQLTPLF